MYISIPMTGVEEKVSERYKSVLEDIHKRKLDEKYDIISPKDIDDFNEFGSSQQMDDEHDYAYFMGEDVKLILRCNALYMTKAWETSKGCRTEHEIAKIYGLRIFYQ